MGQPSILRRGKVTSRDGRAYHNLGDVDGVRMCSPVELNKKSNPKQVGLGLL